MMKQTNHPKLKVCGLTQPDQCHQLKQLGVDFLGFIFYEKSPRYVLKYLTLKQIAEIKHHGKVGVFVNESIAEIAETAAEAQLDAVQLHGNEDEQYVAYLRKTIGANIQIIKVLRVGGDLHSLQHQMHKFNENQNVDFLLFDTDSQAFGGTGKPFDWNILNEIKILKPYFLSGGISPENFENIKLLKQAPFALDINSKFETKAGVKNLDQIKTFKQKIDHDEL